MTEHEPKPTVGQLPTVSTAASHVPNAVTTLCWLLWIVGLRVLAAHIRGGGPWEIPGIVVVDGLTAVMWTAVGFFAAIVASYSKRYLAGSQTIDQFFARVFAFTLVVMVLVAADSLALFVAAWIAMGLVMASLIGHNSKWPQAQAAAALARRYFLAGGLSLAVAVTGLWWFGDITSVSGVEAAIASLPRPVLVAIAAALVIAATIQSALLPFHTWLLSSMTAPTPASALMHAGFVNAGGILLVRFAPIVAAEPAIMAAIVLVGATSALGGKLLKTVTTDAKRALGCSTVGQMGFMLMQVGLGFFAAAVAHLIVHGFYKAYQFLSAGSAIEHTAPGHDKTATAEPTKSTGLGGFVAIAATGLAGGALFAWLTGKGTSLDSGLVLTLLVVVTVLHASRDVVRSSGIPASVRYGAVPLVALPAIAVYAGVYQLVSSRLAALPAVGEPASLTAVHILIAAAFIIAYIAVETGVYRRSRRLYVALVNATQPPSNTLLFTTEEYNEQ